MATEEGETKKTRLLREKTRKGNRNRGTNWPPLQRAMMIKKVSDRILCLRDGGTIDGEQSRPRKTEGTKPEVK